MTMRETPTESLFKVESLPILDREEQLADNLPFLFPSTPKTETTTQTTTLVASGARRLADSRVRSLTITVCWLRASTARRQQLQKRRLAPS